MRDLPKIYWDSSCFLAWLKPEQSRRKQCKEVLEAAENKELVIYTSAIALIEVIRGDKGPLRIQENQEQKIRGFFEQPYIVIAQVTRQIAEAARQLIWSENLRPRDSVHIATAIDLGVLEVHCFDQKMISLSSKEILGHTLKILEPCAQQPSLDFELSASSLDSDKDETPSEAGELLQEDPTSEEEES